MDHLNTAREVSSDTTYNNKNLDQRVLGKFYTPEPIARFLSTQICEALTSFEKNEEITISDPFAGDGRMISIMLSELEKTLFFENFKAINIFLFELDTDALENLNLLARELEKKYGTKISLEIFNQDSFLSDKIRNYFNRIDIVITNPPWELLKPDSREMGEMSKEHKLSYVSSLKQYDSHLAQLLPFSQPKKKFAGWGTNLSRCGLELSLKLLSTNGVLGIVLPSSVFSDQMSEKLREYALSENTFTNFNFYPATTKAFVGVDQDFISTTCIKKSAKIESAIDYTLNIFDKNLKLDSTEDINLDFDYLKGNEFLIPLEHGREFVDIMKIISSNPKFSTFEKSNSKLSIYAGREMDETGIANKLQTNGISFIKGRSVSRYNYSKEKPMFVDPLFAEDFQSVKLPRMVWRDVARKSQTRRVQSMVIDKDILTGNSLHMMYSKNGDLNYLKALSVIFNSMVFEAQVRSKLSTNHISLGVVRCCHIPLLEETSIESLSQLYDINPKTPALLAEIETIVSELFGLSESQLLYLANGFFPNDETTTLLNKTQINS